jgi:hypothetical protein
VFDEMFKKSKRKKMELLLKLIVVPNSVRNRTNISRRKKNPNKTDNGIKL